MWNLEVCNVEFGSVQFGSEHGPNGPPYDPELTLAFITACNRVILRILT